HFFNPVRYMKLLEIIAGEETLPEIVEFMADYGERIPGFSSCWPVLRHSPSLHRIILSIT
ncbi:MAG: 3-hydroxyacyl-CoA dehydrogenase NAD-binding domain-containing protein, partial [Thermodesulfobacteriota bacterium]|nr:3-hydroxyacyl-CoA dehydrogenase NAD-binding domain-containing protein [Thermodesulfobacteriota bacterium]